MFDEVFLHKKISPEKLIAFGFESAGQVYHRTFPIMGGDFLLTVTFDRHGNPDTSLCECDTGEEYVLYKTEAQGSFVGEVREAIEEVLETVAAACFESSIFRQAQTLDLLAHAAETYRNEPEFLWKRTPENGILRRRDSGKWYAAILTIPRSKLGFDSDRLVEIVDLHATCERIQELLMRPEIHPGWHMNKKSWFTVVLDGSVENAELFEMLAESYRLAGT